MIRNLFATIVLAAASLCALAAVDANKATQAELEALPGVGPTLSSRIVTERQKTPFKNWGDLIERVHGIGTGNATKLSKGGLTVGNAAYVQAAKAASPTPAAAK
ncbi:MAG: helix-hairpin-helix domain-containing protein [Rubrivivax sp.]|nr:helix-hairpin-helix domain-containing protein [Rubrivivax sp.]MDH5339458.1 helix-hairpin-helix domain-containing protein [Rubrivivax sp.]